MSDPEAPSPPPTTLPALFAPVARGKDRSNGWKPDVQRAFIEALADTGSVAAACKRVGRATTGAYQLRRQPDASEFAAAWAAALDHGMRRIEDVAMDRALNGVEQPVYSYGKLVGTRMVHNDRLLMFLLRNRAPERFAAHRGNGAGGKLDAVGKMEMRRLKRKWKAKWRKQWEAEQPGHKAHTVVEARALIEQKLADLRQRVSAHRGQEWRTLSPETRDAWRHYEALRARDLGRAVEPDPHLPGEEELAAEEAEQAARMAQRRAAAQEEAALTLPPEGWGKVEDVEDETGPRIRTVKDEGW